MESIFMSQKWILADILQGLGNLIIGSAIILFYFHKVLKKQGSTIFLFSLGLIAILKAVSILYFYGILRVYYFIYVLSIMEFALVIYSIKKGDLFFLGEIFEKVLKKTRIRAIRILYIIFILLSVFIIILNIINIVYLWNNGATLLSH
ncbi:MAG: hypothetical protein ABH873_08805 [Candidatus Firestonebacteria bacterium]